MIELMNSPLILSLVFPTLCVLGIVPLLRWAVSGEKRDVYASFSLALACLIACICAYGRPGEAFQFGVAALTYALGVSSFLSLFTTLWVTNNFLRFCFVLINLLLTCWILVGMPMELDMLVKALWAGYILLVMAGVAILRTRWELNEDSYAIGPFISLLVVAATLGLISFWVGDGTSVNFAVALCVICMASLIWTIRKFGFRYQENALLPLSLCVAVLMWDLWLQGHLNLVSVVLLLASLFSRSAVIKVLSGAPNWMQKGYYVFILGFSILPAFLSVVFFDILRNL
jgi:uncharacterized membrane protein